MLFPRGTDVVDDIAISKILNMSKKRCFSAPEAVLRQSTAEAWLSHGAVMQAMSPQSEKGLEFDIRVASVDGEPPPTTAMTTTPVPCNREVTTKHLETAQFMLLHCSVRHEQIVCTHLLVCHFLFSLSYAVKEPQNV